MEPVPNEKKKRPDSLLRDFGLVLGSALLGGGAALVLSFLIRMIASNDHDAIARQHNVNHQSARPVNRVDGVSGRSETDKNTHAFKAVQPEGVAKLHQKEPPRKTPKVTASPEGALVVAVKSQKKDSRSLNANDPKLGHSRRTVLSVQNSQQGEKKASSEITASAPIALTAPTREAVRSSLEGVRDAVQACVGEQNGMARVHLTISSAGNVMTAQVTQGRWANSREGECIEKAVRDAKFPPFLSSRFEVDYPFLIAPKQDSQTLLMEEVPGL